MICLYAQRGSFHPQTNAAGIRVAADPVLKKNQRSIVHDVIHHVSDRSQDVRADQAAEQRLVARARDGDPAAFRELVERYEGLVAATVIGMLGRGAEAQDVGQKTFIKFYRALDQYRGEGGVAPYLTRIAVNLSLNALDRRKRHRRRFASSDPDDLPAYEPAVDGERDARRFDEKDMVHRAIQQLNPDHRSVVVLRMINGYSTKETAELLDIPVGTVLSRLYRAQQNLRDLLGPYLEDDYEG